MTCAHPGSIPGYRGGLVLQASGVHREDRVQSQGRLDDAVRRAMELRVLCAQARADAAGLKVDTAELLVATAETRERALRARENRDFSNPASTRCSRRHGT
jgi:hypothetical protein